MRTPNTTVFAILVLLLTVLVMAVVFFVLKTSTDRSTALDTLETNRGVCESAVNDFMNASDRMTNDVNLYAIDGDPSRLEDYWSVVDDTRDRDVAIQKLLHADLSVQERSHILRAKALSDGLISGETWAMRMSAEGFGADLSALPAVVASYTLSSADEALTPAEKRSAAQAYLFGTEYQDAKQSMRNAVQTFREDLSSRLEVSAAASLEAGKRSSTVAIVGMAILFAALIGCTVAYSRMMAAKNEQLAVALRRAEAASVAKGTFTSRMSHEIRTPLNAVIGFMALADQEKDPSQKGEQIKKARIAANSLLRIINDVLDLSAIENGRVRIAHEPFRISSVIEGLQLVYSSQAIEKGITLLFSYDEVTSDLVMGDRQRITQILTNLLSNAVKFTPSGGKVTCTVRQPVPEEVGASAGGKTPARVSTTFTVADTGIGMSREFLGRVFEAYEQADTSISQRYGGTGLGLSIVKSMTEMMGGTVELESEEGLGSTFRVRLTYEVAPEESSPSPSASDEPVAVWSEGSEPISGMRLLLVEDNIMNSEIAVNILERNGATVTRAFDGQEGVETFSNCPVGSFDVILMDIQMPRLNGYDAARLIRSLDRQDAKSVPIVAMTANAFDEDVQRAFDAGMNAHIAKPLDVPVMISTILRYRAPQDGEAGR